MPSLKASALAMIALEPVLFYLHGKGVGSCLSYTEYHDLRLYLRMRGLGDYSAAGLGLHAIGFTLCRVAFAHSLIMVLGNWSCGRPLLNEASYL